MFRLLADLGYYDVTILVAVVGLYILLAVLWVIYSLVDRESERSAVAISLERRRQSPVGLLEVQRLEREIVLLRRQADESEDQIQLLQEAVERVRLLLQMQSAAGCESSLENPSTDITPIVHRVVESNQADVLEVESTASNSSPVTKPLAHLPLVAKYEEFNAYSDAEMGVILMKRPQKSDDLTKIWGVGAVNQDLLNQNGIFFLDQIASWNDYNVWKFNELLSFKGRIEREQWVTQAQRLCSEGSDPLIRKAA